MVLLGLVGFIACFAFSSGAVIWVFISEIFPNGVRAKGQALGSFTHWFTAALVSWIFPIVAERSGAWAFGFLQSDDGSAVYLRLEDHARDHGRKIGGH